MGFEIYGNTPKNPCGEYFRNSTCGWRPLATYACEVAPELTAKCKHWYTNDFDGLNGEDSILLADLLQKEIDSGRTEKYARLWHSEHKMTLSELFLFYRRTGTLPKPGDPTNNGIVCNICNGEGPHRHWVERLQGGIYHGHEV